MSVMALFAQLCKERRLRLLPGNSNFSIQNTRGEFIPARLSLRSRSLSIRERKGSCAPWYPDPR